MLGKCKKLVENVFSRTFSRAQPNTWKYFLKFFSECNQTLENILFSKIYFHVKMF